MELFQIPDGYSGVWKLFNCTLKHTQTDMAHSPGAVFFLTLEQRKFLKDIWSNTFILVSRSFANKFYFQRIYSLLMVISEELEYFRKIFRYFEENVTK